MRYLIGILLVVGLAIAFFNGDDEGSGNESRAADTADEPNARITGEFVEWQPVDDARGYAVFTITNHGPDDGVAECTIEVSNDFGNFGFDSLVGEPIEAGETINGRIALDVDEGSFLINEGSVKDC